jgi:osmoprotectant transport system ATP-binding protein
MKLINRLLEPDSGIISINGQDIRLQDKVELRRHIGYVIQQIGLFPNMTVAQNISVVPKLLKYDKTRCAEIVQEMLKLVRMEDYAEKYPSELSGGQQQRIGVLRALAASPPIVLMDEPFGALDPQTREALQDEVKNLQQRLGKTIIFVTHDMDEAVKIADKICIMRGGHILQYDTPEVILKNPADEFVANFVGINRIWDSPEYIKVKDFMIKKPVTCKANLSRSRCIKRMHDHHIDTLIVVDDSNCIQGIVGRKDLFKASPLADAGGMMHEANYLAYVEDNIVDVLKMVEESDVSNVPVVDKEGRLAGLLTSSSLVSTMSKQFISGDQISGDAANKGVR